MLRCGSRHGDGHQAIHQLISRSIDLAYDPQTYWESAHARDDLSSVGQIGYSAAWNRWLYRAWLTTGLRFLREQHVTARSVCDVGAGRGSWFPVWRAIGAQHITATDRSQVAVDRLGGDRNHLLDIARKGSAASMGEFDLVAAMYVLLHVTDEAGFDAARDNLASLVRRDGYLLVADPIVLGSRESLSIEGAPSRARRLDDYEFPGLARVGIGAATVIGSDPVERHGWWEWPERVRWGVTARLGSQLPWLLGPIIATVDPWLARRTSLMPSAKLVLYQRVR